MAWCKMCVLVRTEYAQDVVIFMNGFAIIAALLFIPPVAIGITKLSFFRRRIDVAAILKTKYQYRNC